MADILNVIDKEVIGQTAYRLNGDETNGGLPRLLTGGAIIALVGGDGAGKTTAVNELYKWLSRNFWSRKIHLGKPRWSWTTLLVRAALKVLGEFRLFLSKARLRRAVGASDASRFLHYAVLLKEVCKARDRYKTYRKARSFAAQGGLVVCDRFPLPQIKLMDGRRCQQHFELVRGNRFSKLLAETEQRYYDRMALPDVLIVLRLNPELAVKRKTDEDATHVRMRSQEIWEMDWTDTPAHVIDAGRSKAEVLREIKSLIWSRL